jgi:small subunit ribosomal protein S6
MNYESTFIVSPEMPTEKIEELIEKVKKAVEASNGQMKLVQQLGKKKLAYPIQKFREGAYVYMELSGPGDMIPALENFYKVHDTVIRYLTVKVEKKPVVKKVEAPVAEVTPAPAEGEVKKDEQQQQSTTTGAE